MHLVDAIRSLGGIAATHELYARGSSRSGLRAAVRDGVLVRIRTGWYCAPDLDVRMQRAARVGGRITCETLAEHLGLWLPFRDLRLHVAVLPDRTQLRDADRYWVRRSDTKDPSVVLHWTAVRRGAHTSVTVVDLLIHLTACHDPLFVFIVAESALRAGLMSPFELQIVRAHVDAAYARLLQDAGAVSESGGESAFAVLLRSLGLPFTQQAWIGGDRVDFLVGRRLVVEVDGRAFHDAARDNRRDARLIGAGMSVLHFDSDMVLLERDVVEATLLRAIARNEHRY